MKPPTTTDDGDSFDPELYVQKQTGRVLTRLIIVVGVLQVGGVFLWLAMVFAGVVDASMNLDGFMIAQLAVFLASIAGGLFWAIRRIRTLRREAEQMQQEGVASGPCDQ